MLRFRVLLGNDDAGKLEVVTQEVVRRLSFAAGFRTSLSPEVGLVDFGFQGREVTYSLGVGLPAGAPRGRGDLHTRTGSPGDRWSEGVTVHRRASPLGAKLGRRLKHRLDCGGHR